MDADDLIYLLMLTVSLLTSFYYRQIQNITLKKSLGTFIGLVLTISVSGLYAIHPILITLVNLSIIKWTNRKSCHIKSFTFTFLYLLYFRCATFFGIQHPSGHTNLIQMILTLKLVGLALEVCQGEINGDLSPIDIVHYAFNYIGLFTGPYYRYKTFQDYFTNGTRIGPKECNRATLSKLKYVPLYAALFLTVSYIWPISFASTYEFYETKSWLYRYWYAWPSFLIFRMRIYIGIILSECICTLAGFGAYPIDQNSQPGNGPTKKSEEHTDKDYDFNTILNVDPYGADFCVTYREALKHWNMCVQYWLAMNVHKRFPMKKYRNIVTMLISAFWHGVHTGYYVCISTAPFVLIVEDVYGKIVKKRNRFINFLHWFLRMHILSYQAIAFFLLDIDKIIYYYNSVYHLTLIVLIILYVLGRIILLVQNRNVKQN